MLGLCTAVLIAAALHFAQAVLAPVAFALFIIALVWPVQRALQALLPRLLALVLTLLGTLVVSAAFALVIVWGFGRVGQWLVGNVGRMQALWLQKAAWLEAQGVTVAGLFAAYFDMRWLVLVFQEVTGTLRGFVTFAVLTLIFTLLGLLEVETARGRLAALARQQWGGGGAATLLAGSAALAAKLRRYMLVRTAMSLLTGVSVWAFARFVGLDLAAEWGVIAFVLNYIPVIGPFMATLLPTLFAALQFESWGMALTVFLTLNVIQFVVGSYLEPRVAGAALAVSPFLVLVSVFAWLALWGIAGAFIGIPILIAVLTFCQQDQRARWIPDLLSGRPEGRA
jgi:predicted PurR-regulated permease PerM